MRTPAPTATGAGSALVSSSSARSSSSEVQIPLAVSSWVVVISAWGCRPHLVPQDGRRRARGWGPGRDVTGSTRWNSSSTPKVAGSHRSRRRRRLGVTADDCRWWAPTRALLCPEGRRRSDAGCPGSRGVGLAVSRVLTVRRGPLGAHQGGAAIDRRICRPEGPKSVHHAAPEAAPDRRYFSRAPRQARRRGRGGPCFTRRPMRAALLSLLYGVGGCFSLVNAAWPAGIRSLR